mmetsp:Transcript_9251/g.8702  ORF Transcript_9251/g.8702 Transcript_9251/m.8702 type:complete len:80 (-) Transcript_9251:203-442(-)
MESYAFTYSAEKGYVQEEGCTRCKIHMSELFHMIAGTSSGSLIAGALSAGKGNGSKEPLMYAPDLLQFYQTEGAHVFEV